MRLSDGVTIAAINAALLSLTCSISGAEITCGSGLPASFDAVLVSTAGGVRGGDFATVLDMGLPFPPPPPPGDSCSIGRTVTRMVSPSLGPPKETGYANAAACKNTESTKKETNLMIVTDWPQPNWGKIAAPFSLLRRGRSYRSGQVSWLRLFSTRRAFP
jgi:hypothetical protein